MRTNHMAIIKARATPSRPLVTHNLVLRGALDAYSSTLQALASMLPYKPPAPSTMLYIHNHGCTALASAQEYITTPKLADPPPKMG